jgi:GNAT superfamily N-acetyltransferase
MAASPGVQIRALAPDDSIAALTELLHRAYAELGAQGLRFTAVDQSESMTRERIAKGRCFVATLNGAIAGTITYYPPRADAISRWYRRPGVACFGQFGVDPTHRGKRIGSSLLAHVETVARGEGVTELALDTAENATALVAMYARMGYRVVDYDNYVVTNYRSVIMSKSLG